MRRNVLDRWVTPPRGHVGKRANAQAIGYYCLSLCKTYLSTFFQVYTDADCKLLNRTDVPQDAFKSFRHDCTDAGKEGGCFLSLLVLNSHGACLLARRRHWQVKRHFIGALHG